MRKIWRIWAKALGQKEGKNDKEADIIAMIRTFIFLQLIITNCFIVAGNIRHWNDHYESPHYELTEQLFVLIIRLSTFLLPIQIQ